MLNKSKFRGISLAFSKFWSELQAIFKPWKDNIDYSDIQGIISKKGSLFQTLQIQSPQQIFFNAKRRNQFSKEESLAFMLSLLNLLRSQVQRLVKQNKFNSLKTLYFQIEQIQKLMVVWQEQVREFYFREERDQRESSRLQSINLKREECEKKLKEFTVKSNENLKITQQFLGSQLRQKFQTIDLTLPKLGLNFLRKSCHHREKLFKLSQIQTLSLSKRPEWAKQNLRQAERLQRMNESLMQEKRKKIVNNLRNQQDKTIVKKLDYLNRRSARAQNQITISVRNQIVTNQKKESIQTHRLYLRESRIENEHKAASRRHSLDTDRYLQTFKRGRDRVIQTNLALGQNIRHISDLSEIRPSQSLCSKYQSELS